MNRKRKNSITNLNSSEDENNNNNDEEYDRVQNNLLSIQSTHNYFSQKEIKH